MGVHGLWELLSPIGHRVSNDNVRNKILAVDISIWLTQFVKAMRDAEGAQVRNSHLLGVFRRCVKLLYLSVKPVLVFDGATPALKRTTLSSRRAQREKHAAKLRRLAEKMLLNRIKQSAVSNAIAKKRKRHLQTNPNKRPSLPEEPKHPPRPIETRGPASQESAGTIEIHQTSDRFTQTGEEPLSYPLASSDLPYEDSDIDDMQIRVPENVDDLDDEVLMKLPTKVQAEVFKQVKLEQRARHRENMMLKRQDPSEFSKMQIEGFLRYTALNRKISRVKNVINSKSGASQRIASDSGRNFILEEDDAFVGTPQVIEASASDDEYRETRSPDVECADRENVDLLADIRARKEATLHGTAATRAQPRKKLGQEARHVESGTGWASKVLEGNGGLLMRPRIPGDSAIRAERHLSSRSDDVSGARLEEQVQLPRVIRDDNGSDHVMPEKEKSTIDNSTSDDDEWEDGNQPSQRSLDDIFDKDLGGSDLEDSELKDISQREEHSKLFGPLSMEYVSRKDGHDSCEPNLGEYHESPQKSGPRNENKETARCRSHRISPESKSEEVGADSQSLNRTTQLVCQSDTVWEGPGAKHNEKCICEEHKDSEPRSALEGTCKGGTSEKRQQPGVNDASLGDDSTPSQSLKIGVQTPASRVPAKDRLVKCVSFVGSEKFPDPGASSEPRNNSMSKGEKEGINTMTSSPSRKSILPKVGYTGSPSSKSLVPSESQAINGLDTEAAVQTGTSKNSRGSKRILASSNFDKSPNLHEKEIVYMHNDDEGSGNGISSLRSNTFSPEGTHCLPAGLNIPHTANEGSSDLECAGPRDISDHTEAREPSLVQLENMQEEFGVEAREIRRQRSLHQGGAESVADEMYAETRDLIKLFGIPYLEAPTEAEAQCAFLNKEKIVDGVLTEDSDAFLFGALTVYRQLFAEGRFAEAYDAEDVQLRLGLDRANLVRLAYLLGSDYTAGVRGVGIVNSMEILEAFPGSSGLEEFREWTKSVTVLDEEPEEEVMGGDNQEAVRRRFCWKHRNMKRNWVVREGFPNPAVFEAYMNPVVDRSREKFTWGPVNFEGLAKFCWEKFGWEKDRFDSAVGPLRQKLEGEKAGMTQRRIDEFFKAHRFAKIRSERLQKAVHGMAGDLSKELMAAQLQGRGTRKITPVTRSTKLSSHFSDEIDEPVVIN